MRLPVQSGTIIRGASNLLSTNNEIQISICYTDSSCTTLYKNPNCSRNYCRMHGVGWKDNNQSDCVVP